jgi:hypothetical protein
MVTPRFYASLRMTSSWHFDFFHNLLQGLFFRVVSVFRG